MEALAGILASAVVAVLLVAFFALFSGKDFGSGFVTFALIVFVLSILSGQWQMAIGVLIGVPTAVAFVVGISSLRGKR
jgi:hypothetical protein